MPPLLRLRGAWEEQRGLLVWEAQRGQGERAPGLPGSGARSLWASPAIPRSLSVHASAHVDPSSRRLGQGLGPKGKAGWWGTVERSGLLAIVHGDRLLGHLSRGLGAPADANHLVSALRPQNMLEQLLIHQPRDPITFMIDHLQRNNDNGESSCPPPPPGNGNREQGRGRL